MSTYRIISAERASFPVSVMCEVLGVSKSGVASAEASGASASSPPALPIVRLRVGAFASRSATPQRSMGHR